jgi:HEAT repeat protein
LGGDAPPQARGVACKRSSIKNGALSRLKPIDVPTATVEQLTNAYRHAAAAHGAATVGSDHEAVNHHHNIVAAIYRELRRRGTAAQLALVPLLQDPDDAVRTWAASHALEFTPEKAERILTEVASGRGLLAFSAKMTLQEWRKGSLSFP